MKRICESWVNETRTNDNSKKKNKNDSKANSKMKRNPYKNKVKIECLICSSKKNKLNNKNNFDSLYTYNPNFFEDEYPYEGYYDTHIQAQGEKSILKEHDLLFYDSSIYYSYHQNDITDILNLPNINDSFSKLDSDESGMLQDSLENSKNMKQKKFQENNLISLDEIGYNNNNNNNLDNDENKAKIKVKTLYSNEDISTKYNYILKKII